MGIKAVLFDLGDTLWHFPNMPPQEVVRAETVARIRRLLQRWGHSMDGDRYFLGRDIRLAVEEATERAFWGDLKSPDYPELCRQVAARHGLELTREQAEELWDTWNLGGRFLGRQLFPDVIPTLEQLKARGFRLGAVTNRGWSGPRFWRELDDLGLAPFFETVAVSCEVGYLKPHPRIFQVALEDMGLRPEETAMVGDSLRADVAGARALGMLAIWRRPPRDEPVEETADRPQDDGEVAPDYTIDSIAQLLELPPLQE
ncbi:MAG: HAD-IA family hydrolase [Dehalococcoidia bacterium]|nr:HAD-IA family hydrolase [Dehalococcoidia bacterium]MDW8009122.1 HAD-IA family hydrolase [Chloroflexota bacterium]